MRWVWEANRGNPVRENATLRLGSDGNLVLADAGGRIAWQTNTTNKGVTGFTILPNGNTVLHDASGNFVWQSFDSPTDTLLLGQSLRAGAVSRLVSRASASVNSNGPYSLVLGSKGFSMYYTSPNSPEPMVYFSSSDLFTFDRGTLVNLTFTSFPEVDDISYLGFDYHVASPASQGNRFLVRPNYNSTLSYLRLGLDGNIRFFTYNDKVDITAWEETYTLFSRDSDVTECQLPERCGKFGLCADNQCVACPSINGLLGWNSTCQAKKLRSCKQSDFKYYKLEGVDHFTSRYTKGDGPMKESECESKCTRDCKCLGYFYRTDWSRCWIAYELKTLIIVGNSTHLGVLKNDAW